MHMGVCAAMTRMQIPLDSLYKIIFQKPLEVHKLVLPVNLTIFSYTIQFCRGNWLTVFTIVIGLKLKTFFIANLFHGILLTFINGVCMTVFLPFLDLKQAIDHTKQHE